MLRVFLLAAMPLAAATTLADVVNIIRQEVRSGDAMRQMHEVWNRDRWFTFPKFQETARYLATEMKRGGLQRVEILGVKADGVTQAGFWTMPLAWDVKSATLEIIEPPVGGRDRILVDYSRVPTGVCMWSGPARELEAEVADWNPSQPESARGKFVLTRQNPAGIKWLLARQGPAAVINTFTENPELTGGRQWINAWGDNGWAFTKGSAPLPCFSITPRQSEQIRDLMRKHGRVKLRARVDSRYYEGAYPYVTAVIPGTELAQEEVLTLGHTSEQGAHDNATGVAAMVEALKTIQRLIKTGRLAPPRRTIRILTMGELYGSMDYVARYPDRIRNTVAAFCVDTPAAPYDMAGTEYTFHLNPHAAASYADAFVLQLASIYYGGRRPYQWKPFTSGTDTFLADPMIGVPTVWPYSGTGVNSHHNSADTPDTVDPRSLHDLTAITASYLYYIAAAGRDEALWLAELAAMRARQLMEQAEGEKRQYLAARGAQAVMSVTRLSPVGSEAAALAPPSNYASSGAGLVVVRKRFGTLPLDDLAPDAREGFPSGAWDNRVITALYWCDGKRTLDEVIRLTRLELGDTKFDWYGYFRFLARHGYVELKE